MNERKGKKVKVFLTNNIIYNGKIINEDELTYTILDKFDKEVTIGKRNLISMEVLE